MKNLVRFLIYVSYAIFITACNNHKIPVDGQMLSGGYMFRYEGFAYLRADNSFKPSIYGDIKACSFDDNYIIVKQKPNKASYINSLAEKFMGDRTLLTKDSLECKPEEYEFYKHYIMINKDLMKVLFAKLSPNHSKSDIETSRIIADSMVENNQFYKSIFKNEINYWILSHNEINNKEYMPLSKIFGPYTKGEYLQKREELGVPKELKLDGE